MKYLALLFASILLSTSNAIVPTFLTEEEIEESRGTPKTSRKATGINTLSSNNDVLPLIDGKDVMLSLLSDIRRAGEGDLITMTTFSVNGDVMLDPTLRKEEAEETKLSNLFLSAIERNVTLKILVNENIYLHTAYNFCKPLNKKAGETVCAAESRHNAIGGSLHAKTWSFIYKDEEVVSYLGSMDIMGERWDTPAHDDGVNRQKQPKDLNHFHGWFGIMYRLSNGDAAVDVARHFWQQWNDPAPLVDRGYIYDLKMYDWVVPEQKITADGVDVQLLRSLSCQGGVDDGLYATFAPRGEYTFTAAFNKMLKNAKKYIYIEDQFVFYEEALAAVAAALPHVEAVIIVTDDARAMSAAVGGFTIETASDMRYFHQKLSMDQLISGDNAKYADKVHIFELAREGYEVGTNMSEGWLYTHAKSYFVDDEFMLGGSHGIERTGFTNDIELSIAISDDKKGPDSFVGKFRRRVWSEFLRIPEDSEILNDPIEALAELERQAQDGINNRIRKYYPEEGASGWANEAVYNLYEPDGRCEGEGKQVEKLGAVKVKEWTEDDFSRDIQLGLKFIK